MRRYLDSAAGACVGLAAMTWAHVAQDGWGLRCKACAGVSIILILAFVSYEAVKRFW